MSSRRRTKNNRGGGLLNTLINSLPVELHLPGGYQFCGPGTDLKKRLSLGQKGINPLDAACRDHDIAYEASNDSSVRETADRVLENRAWENFKTASNIAEKAASWAVTTGMKAKGKMGAGCGFKNIVGVARKAVMKSIKTCPASANMSGMIRAAVAAAKKHVRTRKTCKKPRVINVPKTGGAMSLIPIFAALSALGTMAGGASNIVKTMGNVASNVAGSPIHLGKGLYLRPHKGDAYRVDGCARARKSSRRKSSGKNRDLRSRKTECKKSSKKN